MDGVSWKINESAMVQKQGGGIGSGIAPAPRRIQIGVPDGSRTHNTTILSRFPLPVGILGRLASSGGAALPPHRVWYAYHIAHTRFFKLHPRATWVFSANATHPRPASNAQRLMLLANRTTRRPRRARPGAACPTTTSTGKNETIPDSADSTADFTGAICPGRALANAARPLRILQDLAGTSGKPP